jgi:outer membrane protein OmpA-like peptidoglycan-associated protein
MKVTKIISLILIACFTLCSVETNAQDRKRSVEPLYWKNPLEFVYNELNSPRRMKLPKPVLDDTDGDGVSDQFDLEPNTPSGAPVDSHGVSKDTDGDGVPDYKDKELITPTACQPVNNDGIGKCPDPECCKLVSSSSASCGINNVPSIVFGKGTPKLSSAAQAILASTAERLKMNPSCKLMVIGYADASKSSQQLSWDRVNAVVTYFFEKLGISSDRFIFKYGQIGGDLNTVEMSGTAELSDLPSMAPAPYPNLRKS